MMREVLALAFASQMSQNFLVIVVANFGLFF